MTDDELKQLVASLAVDQKELTQKMAQTEAQMQRTDEKLNKVAELIGNIGRNQGDISDLAIAQQKTEAQMKLTDEKLNKVAELIGNIGNNQGDVSEEFFYNSLVEDTRLGDIHFDDIMQNTKNHRGKVQEEYDILMTNGNTVGIVEVKYKAHEKDLDKLERKMRNFKNLYPRYADCKVYGALAAFHVNEVAKKEALERGFFVLQRYGKVLHSECGQDLLVL